MEQFIDIPIRDSRLAACLHLPSAAAAGGGPAPIVICCHGLTGTRVGSAYRFVSIARRLEERGIGCMRFDFHGCGESGGRFEDLTAKTVGEDLQVVLAFLTDEPRCDTRRVGLLGSSYGAYTAARAAPSVVGLRCLAFIAPVASARDLIDRDMTPPAWALLERQGWVDHHGLPLGRGFFETASNEEVPAILACSRRPLLIFHAAGDSQVPISHGRAYESALRGVGVEVQFEVIDARDHGMRNAAANQRIIDGCVAWFCRHLAAESR